MPILQPPKKFELLPLGKAILEINRFVAKTMDKDSAGAPMLTFELKHAETGALIPLQLTETDQPEWKAWRMNEFTFGFRINEEFKLEMDQGWSFDQDTAVQNNWTYIDPAACVGLRAAVMIEHRPGKKKNPDDKNEVVKLFNQIVYPTGSPKQTCVPGTEHLRSKSAAPAGAKNEAW